MKNKSGAKRSENQKGMRHPQLLTASSERHLRTMVVTAEANRNPPTCPNSKK
jgi:hypothetical protein